MREHIMRCFEDGDALEPFNTGTFKHVAPAARNLGDTLHHVLSSTQIFAATGDQIITACHGITANLTICHDLTNHDAARLFRVETEKHNAGGGIELATLSVMCHQSDDQSRPSAYAAGC